MLSFLSSLKMLRILGTMQPGLITVSTPDHGSRLFYFPLGWWLWPVPLEAQVRSQGSVPCLSLLPARLKNFTCSPTAGASKSWRYQGAKNRGKKTLTCSKMWNFVPLLCEILLIFSLFSHGNTLEHTFLVLGEKNFMNEFTAFSSAKASLS